MRRRGQVSIFIILGIVLLIVIGVTVFFYTKGTIKNTTASVPIKSLSDNVNSEINSCLEDALTTVLESVSLQGGYYAAPLDSSNNDPLNSGFVAVYFDGETVTIPSTNIVLEHISKGVQLESIPCLNKIANDEVTMNISSMKLSARFINETLHITLLEQVLIGRGETTTQIDSFTIQRDVLLPKYLQAAQELTLEQESHPSTICISCIPEIAKKYNMHVNTDEIPDGNKLLIVYYLSEENNNEYFVFAHELEPKEGESP